MKKWILTSIVLFVLILIALFVFTKKTHTTTQQQPMDNTQPTSATTDSLEITPLSHATMVIHLGGQSIYTDPVGGKEAFLNQPSPNLILITDIHGDHLNAETLTAVSKEETTIIVPQAVADQLPSNLSGIVVIMKNGEKKTEKGIEIEAIPMYNLPESNDAMHTKGRGNGYVISGGGKRVYIAGDTDAIPEMKALKNIDIAFVPMNPPYTMDVEEAAEGVLAFKPKIVHPYHYRTPNGLSDVNKFKELVESKDSTIKVELLNFYPTP